MHHITIGVFGNRDFMKSMAKKGTVNDIMICNHASSESILTCAAPNSPEEKIQPLLQTINMIDIPVIVCGSMTKELAEQLVALDAFGFAQGFIVSHSDELRKLIQGTSIEKFEWVTDEKELRKRLNSIDAQPLTMGVWVPVDNYFSVKSVGTVVLSIIKGGIVKKYDKLIIQPLGKDVMVKGIQSQDKDIEEAAYGMRAGISLKGVEAEEIKRGYVLCNSASVSKNVSMNFSKNRYSRETLKNGMQLFASIGLQVIPGKIDSMENNTMSISLEHPAVYLSGQKCLLATTGQNMPRIAGTGILKM